MHVFMVVLTKLNDPFGDQVLDIATYSDRQMAEVVSRSWAELPEVKAGRHRVKLVPRLLPGLPPLVADQCDRGRLLS